METTYAAILPLNRRDIVANPIMSNDNRIPYGSLLNAAGMLVASWMPWGRVPTDDEMSVSMRSMLSMPVHEGHLTITARNIDINLCGVQIPNWGPLVASLFLVTLLVLRAFGLWTAPKLASIALVAYGLVHLFCLSAMLMEHGDIGAGSLLSFGCFLMLSATTIWLMVRQMVDDSAAKVANTVRRVPYTR
jgi:hypothetical protein